MTAAQAQALATLVTRLRPDWDHVGLVSVIGKARHLGSPIQISRALLVLAENRELRTPALLVEKGRHWVQDGEPVGPNVSHNVRCVEHPINFMPCPLCAAKRTPPPVDDPDYAAMKQRLKARAQIAPESRRTLADFENQEAKP